jgi:uncharacterized membrane protein YphA (DoxX/SURF4 family)
VAAVGSTTTLDTARARDVLGLAARLVVGGVFLVAGGLKVGHPAVSARAVQAYQILPFDLAAYVGYALPVLEILLGILLVLGLFTRPVAVVAGLLLVVFMAGIASVWARGLSIDCGCFGQGGTVAPGRTRYLPELLRDSGLLACAMWLVARPATLWSLDRGWFS